jgi:enoyl-CoA hydratase/carnithine racemase
MSMLRVEDRARVRLLTLDRPKSLNAFNNELYSLVTAALSDSSSRDDVAVVVLTGEGRAFSVGQDLAEMAAAGGAVAGRGRGVTPDPEAREGYTGDRDAGHRAVVTGSRSDYAFASFMDSLMAFEKPLVAAVNGLAVGLGVTLLAYCDLVVVSEEARLRAPFVSLGVVPEAGSSYTLPVAMGRQRANHFLLTAQWIGAAAAVESGLAWRSVAADRLLEEAMKVASDIAAMPVVSLVETKRLLMANRVDPTRAAREREEEAFSRLVGAPANREALSAFLEKRDPDFFNLPAD